MLRRFTMTMALMAAGFMAALAIAAERPDPAAVVEKTDFAAAKPAKPRKVLIYSHCNGFPHTQAIAAAKIAFPAMGKKTGAFECVVSDDLANFEADKLSEFDAVIFSNTTGDSFTGKAFDKCAKKPAKGEEAQTTERLRKNLVEFVKGGKGIMGIHSACDSNYGWREWGEMLGGYFIGHPWGKIWATNDDPTSPVNAAFNGKDFEISDEIYTFGPSRKLKWDAYGRDVNRVLLSVDMKKSGIARGPRADGDHGLSWIKTYGNGRTFYCAFGHDERAFVNPAVLRHMLAGLQFILGDLKADAAPKPRPARTESGSAVIRVACVGDSITQGVGAGRGQSYPDQLGRMLGSGYVVGNFGVSGSTLLNRGDRPYQKQKKFAPALAFQPNVVIIMLGTNDTKPQNWQHKGEFAADYKDLIRRFAALPSKPKIFVCHPAPVPDGGNFGINEAGVREEAPLIDEVAREMKAEVIDMYAALKDHPEMLPDKVHPNAAGATQLAKAAYKALTGKESQSEAPKRAAKKAA